MHDLDDMTTRLLGQPFAKLNPHAQKVARQVAARQHTARDLLDRTALPASPGQRAADAVARFGGSWTFVGLFLAVMLVWVGLNIVLLARRGSTFDPYPFILLNLFLSMLAAIQAPVILMSQNRQAEKDRLGAEHDYEINLKAELEILLLHEKVDALRATQWDALLRVQQEQLSLLKSLARQAPATGA